MPAKSDIAPGRRAGLWTTEFWIAGVATVVCGVAAFVTDAHAVALGGLVANAVGYQVSRALIKRARVRVDL